jgi:hypothetical protein
MHDNLLAYFACLACLLVTLLASYACLLAACWLAGFCQLCMAIFWLVCLPVCWLILPVMPAYYPPAGWLFLPA